MKKKSPKVKFVPRLIFDHWASKNYLNVFDDHNLADKLAHIISKAVIDHKFDGIVLELWSQLGGQAKVETTHLVSLVYHFVFSLQFSAGLPCNIKDVLLE